MVMVSALPPLPLILNYFGKKFSFGKRWYSPFPVFLTTHLIFIILQSYQTNAVKYVFSANTVLILIQYFLGQISVLNLTEFFIARN